ncbi:MAG: diadenylate cyclase CdaA [Ignavibacteriaceae bacterium]|jgi:diadenylate cyclase
MFDLIKISFLTVTFTDLLDIVIVSFIIYELYKNLKGTIASQIFIGLMIILLLSFAAQAANFKELSWLLKLVTDIWVIAFVILFQPEIRRILVIVARNPFFRLFVKSESPKTPQVIADAAFELSQKQHGALIVVLKSTGIRGFSETGEIMNAKISVPLLETIFFPRSPLHDGAVIVKNDVIEAAGCTLPLSLTTIVNGEHLGMRHRAGLGISEQADVISVIVSEETGSISIAENGRVTKGLSKEMLRKKLSWTFKSPSEKGLKGLIEQYFRKK